MSCKIWQFLTKCQIKNLTKVFLYTVRIYNIVLFTNPSLQPYTFPPLTSNAGYEVQSNGRISVAEHSETQYTITRLEPTTSYSIRVRARFHFSEYCITRSFRYTQWTNRFTVTTIETGIEHQVLIDSKEKGVCSIPLYDMTVH